MGAPERGVYADFEYGQIVWSPDQRMTIAAYVTGDSTNPPDGIEIQWNIGCPYKYDKVLVRWDWDGRDHNDNWQLDGPGGNAGSVQLPMEVGGRPRRKERIGISERPDLILTSRFDRLEYGTTREVQTCEAKTHLPQLLDEVERGEPIIITRHGRPIACIVPEAYRRQREIDQALADIQELRKHTGKVSIEEILAWRHEGHKY